MVSAIAVMASPPGRGRRLRRSRRVAASTSSAMKMSEITATPAAPTAITAAALVWSMPAMPQQGKPGPPLTGAGDQRGQPVDADRGFGVWLAAGLEHRADAGIVDDRRIQPVGFGRVVNGRPDDGPGTQ